MPDNIDISVIVPVYNADKYLSRCLESIINQTYRNLEIILVNDGSTDLSGKILEEYAQRDQRVIAIHKQNGGVSSARNKGIDAARGKYITFVDADDYIHQDMYSSMINITMDQNVDLTFCGIIRQTRTKNERIGFAGKTVVFQEHDIKEHIFADITHNRLMRAPWNKLYKHEIINSNKIRFFEDVEYGEDFIFNLEYLSNVHTVCYIDELLYYYDNTTEGASNTSQNNLLLSGKLINEKLSICAERWNIKSRRFKAESIGEYVFFARTQLRMNMNNSARITMKEQYEKLKDIVYDKDFGENISRDKFILFLVFLQKNMTCKLIILAVALRLPGLLFGKIWLNYMTNRWCDRKPPNRQTK